MLGNVGVKSLIGAGTRSVTTVKARAAAVIATITTRWVVVRHNEGIG